MYAIAMAKDSFGPTDDKAKIEAAIRAAASAAARGVPLGEAVYQYILAKSNEPGLSVADRISRAVSLAENYAASEKPLNQISATPNEIKAQEASEKFAARRGAFPLGRGGNQFTDLKEAGVRSGVSSYVIADYTKQYSGMGFAPDTISTFAAVMLSSKDFRDLEGRGLKTYEIIAAARDTKAMGLTGKDDVEHAAHADAGVKDHLKRAHRAHTRGDDGTTRSEIDKADRANATVRDKDKQHHGEGLIDDFRKQHGIEPNAKATVDKIVKPQDTPDVSADAAAKTMFEKLKAKQVQLHKP